jgi:hypothetical protein
MSLRRRREGLAAVVVALCASLVLAGCSSPDDTELQFADEGVVRPSASPLSQESQTLVDNVWTIYLKLNDIYLKAAKSGEYDWNKDLSKRPMYPYAGGRYVEALERDLNSMSTQGLVRTGEPKTTLRRVMSVTNTSVTVEVCLDDTGTDTVDKKTGKSVALPGQNKKYPVTMRAGLYADGLWRWVDAAAARDSSC